MMQLPNGFSISEIAVIPSNWKSKNADLKRTWIIHYRFYDPSLRSDPKFKNGKLIRIKAGINRLNTVIERQNAVRSIIDAEMERLCSKDYNPITGSMKAEENADVSKLPLIDALTFGYENKKCEPKTKVDLRSVLKYSSKAISECGLENLPIARLTRKDAKQILDTIGKSKGEAWTASLYNYYRAHLAMLVKELIEYDAIEINPFSAIGKMKTVKRIRETLSNDQRQLIKEHLQKTRPEFWRFLQIFFHSGAREIELLRVKWEDVDLDRQFFKVLIKKGNQPIEVHKPIKDVAKPYWEEIMAIGHPGDYLFGPGLLPARLEKPIGTDQISKRWRVHVKRKLGITADFYSLKHLNTDETAALLDLESAAMQNSHTSTVITLKHYAHGEKARQMEKLRKVANNFA